MINHRPPLPKSGVARDAAAFRFCVCNGSTGVCVLFKRMPGFGWFNLRKVCFVCVTDDRQSNVPSHQLTWNLARGGGGPGISPSSLAKGTTIGVLFGCFGRKVEPGLPGGLIIYQGNPSISPRRTPMNRRGAARRVPCSLGPRGGPSRGARWRGRCASRGRRCWASGPGRGCPGAFGFRRAAEKAEAEKTKAGGAAFQVARICGHLSF